MKDTPVKKRGRPRKNPVTKDDMELKIDSLQVQLNGLQEILSHRQEEVSKLFDQKVNLEADVERLDQDIDRKKRDLSQASELSNKERDLELAAVKKTLDNQERSLVSWEESLRARDSEVVHREERMSVLEQEERRIDQRLIDIEKLRIGLIQKEELVSSREKDAEDKLVSAKELSKQAQIDLDQVDRSHQELLTKEAELNEKLRVCDLREKAMKDLERIVDPKLIELKQLEENIQLKENQLKLRQEELHDIEIRLAQATEMLQAK